MAFCLYLHLLATRIVNVMKGGVTICRTSGRNIETKPGHALVVRSLQTHLPFVFSTLYTLVHMMMLSLYYGCTSTCVIDVMREMDCKEEVEFGFIVVLFKGC